MKKELAARLWLEIDRELSALDARPRARGNGRRVYACTRGGHALFVVVRRGEVAGGSFIFEFARTQAPGADDHADAALPPSAGALFVSGDALGLAGAQVNVDLAWQAPSAPLVQAAMAHPDAAWLFPQLGVDAERGHHQLSYEILETLGVAIPPEEYEPVAARFAERLRVFAAQLPAALERLAAVSR
jgi:hypothetical protein